MTRQRDFKTLVRRRMERTGERYATARMHVLRQAPTGAQTPIPAVGGQQADLAAARNLVANAGATGPGGKALTEAMAFGLAGGIGFLYGVFSYAEGPTMTIVARNQSMPDPFLEPLFQATGTEILIETTGGAATAAKRLNRHLESGTPMLCTVASGLLPYLGSPDDESAAAPHVVGVIGAGDGQLLLDDRSPRPVAVDRNEFATAHAGYRKARHRTITVTSVADGHDWERAIGEALRRGVDGFDTPPVPQFASNVGLAGLEKWAGLLTDHRDEKGWPRLFDSGPRAALGLSRLYECITNSYTAPAAGRPLFSDYLAEASQVIDHPGIGAGAEAFAASGDKWGQVTELIVSGGEDLAAYAQAAEQRTAVIDDEPDPDRMHALGSEQRQLVAEATISSQDAAELYTAIAAVVDEIIELERHGLSELRMR